ncbi:MAG: TatD family hydrolase [Muribaculaceae bacterium]|nr:TatD family hydrolase [Muribaculaceae bacterium]
MTDTHTHIYFSEFDEDIDEVISRSEESGVTYFILPNVDEESLPLMKALHEKYPGKTSMALGIHPTEVKEDWPEIVEHFNKELESGLYKGVGEIGMDLYWDQTTKELQKAAFESQLRLAQKYQLPVIIHSRNAFEETMEVVEKVKPTVPLIFHSFTGKSSDVERIRKGCDPYFGINGVVTYKNAPELRESLKTIGIDKIVLETDAPYLSPVPHRGKRNDPTFIPFIRDKIAECLEISPEEVERITDKNAKEIFGF